MLQLLEDGFITKRDVTKIEEALMQAQSRRDRR
jgi:hypothetical protein